jgi:extracellular factor (EF) 3-hydroxypalmitic acid methyl ester biosynthesis protein
MSTDKKPPKTNEPEDSGTEPMGSVVCHNSDGLELRGSILRLTPHTITFELYGGGELVRTSEVLGEVKVLIDRQWLHCGRAVISGLINTGTTVVCQATLGESYFEAAESPSESMPRLSHQFKDFLGAWQNSYRVLPEFKAVVADIRSLLADFRIWVDRLELGARSSPSGERSERQREIIEELGPPAVRTIDALHERFEEIGRNLEEHMRGVHIHFARQQLHPLLLCSPFAYRTYYKPLGYAGDYEMVNMILRDPYEGSSLFAKTVNAWFLDQLPARAHRNRINYLVTKLIGESARTAHAGRRTRVYNIGCGPASEIERFFQQSALANQTDFKLMDFNQETIQNTSKALDTAKRINGRTPRIDFERKPVQSLLKDAARSVINSPSGQFDLIYCAGLFDYLSDRVCKQLLGIFYEWLAPEGLLVATNVNEALPFRNKLEFILDWNLIYRTGKQLASLAPDSVPADARVVLSDSTGVNVLIELRKPRCG